jgi:hypothetical protein
MGLDGWRDAHLRAVCEQMIEPISWEFRRPREENPFRPGSSLPLQVTLHSSSFAKLRNNERAALELIKELAPDGAVDILETDSTAKRYLKIETSARPGRDFLDLTIWEDGEARLFSGIDYPKQELDTARSVTGISSSSDPIVQEAFADLLVAAAHRTLDRDLLVTGSPWILHSKSRSTAKDSKARSLGEAIKIIGLFLRGRGDYRFRGQRRSWSEPINFDRSLFYWVLARQLTPAMWRYFSACVALGESHGREYLAMGSSILTRCKHALQARDFIGSAFYAPDEGAKDATEYHFDYLALLLVGALDVQARIAHRAYGASGDKRVNFRHTGFLTQLKKQGATALFELLSRDETRAFLTLLFEVRNTIHSASMGSHGHHTTGRGPGWLEIEEGEFARTLWEAAVAAGGPEQWGMTKYRFRRDSEDARVEEAIRLMPYPYADQLTQRGIALVNDVARATDIARLFTRSPMPELPDSPRGDRIFNSDVMTRIGLLGGGT